MGLRNDIPIKQFFSEHIILSYHIILYHIISYHIISYVSFFHTLTLNEFFLYLKLKNGIPHFYLELKYNFSVQDVSRKVESFF